MLHACSNMHVTSMQPLRRCSCSGETRNTVLVRISSYQVPGMGDEDEGAAQKKKKKKLDLEVDGYHVRLLIVQADKSQGR